MTIRCVLFDLGGVLAGFRGVERVAEWMGDAEVAEEHWHRWLGASSVREFEIGRLSTEEFAVAFVEELGIEITAEELLEELHGFVTGPMEGAVELLDELRPHFIVACLSNTNELHWPWMAREMELERRLHHAFPSYLTGRLKPDAESFEQVCSTLGLAPGEILFFDDAPPNIDAARALGFAAVRVNGPADCRRELERRGLLAPGA
jgi:putative hydrolase of the HAD superfamily